MTGKLHYDVLIVGAGPAGLSAAIRLKQHKADLRILILEKSAEIGGHILSGCVFEPRALYELLPETFSATVDFSFTDFPAAQPVTQEAFYYLGKKKAWMMPTLPPYRNAGNYIISLGALCQYLAEKAMSLGVDILTGFAAAALIEENSVIKGVMSNAFGTDKTGKPTAQYQAETPIYADYTLVAEGCRGSLAELLIKRYALRANTKSQQTYALGLKEIWQVPKEKHRPGQIEHTLGWPLDKKTYGGGFLYHAANNHIYIGFVIGLDYQDPRINPYLLFQTFKKHPRYADLLSSGKRLAYGAKTLVEGGLTALPGLSFPGGMLIGDAAGFLNVPKIKGSHAAMKSGMLAADALWEAWGAEQVDYFPKFQASWLYEELYRARNVRFAFHYGQSLGLLYTAVEYYLLRQHVPWTLKNKKADHARLKRIRPTEKLPPAFMSMQFDNQCTFTMDLSLQLAHLSHSPDQPCHLKLKDVHVPINYNLTHYGLPEQYYCPAGVYGLIQTPDKKFLIQPENCLHCKTCDIKDPTQNIQWTPPEGGSGPNYREM